MRKLYLAMALAAVGAAPAGGNLKLGRWQETNTMTSISVDGTARALTANEKQPSIGFHCVNEFKTQPEVYFEHVFHAVCAPTHLTIADGSIQVSRSCNYFGVDTVEQTETTGSWTSTAYRYDDTNTSRNPRETRTITRHIEGRFMAGRCDSNDD